MGHVFPATVSIKYIYTNLKVMRHLIRKMTMMKGIREAARAEVCAETFSSDTKNPGYREAVKALNLLQTNASVLQELREKRRNQEIRDQLSDTRKFISRSGISSEELDSLPVIHVAGTKGKGSTCAFCESILRHYGMKKTKEGYVKKGTPDLPSTSIQTGLYTSPHLIEVRERIQLNGRPISHKLFALYFWKVYNELMEKRDHEKDMPHYFKFLTILAFNVFIKEGVDVAIIEVGIGGEKDCTNVIRKPIAVGITTLGLDHQKTLGDTLEKIAWQKAGIMKKGCPAFTALGQAPSALNVLEERAQEKEVSLKVCPPLSSYFFRQYPLNLCMSSPVQEVNASLALQLANAWLKWHKKSSNEDANGTAKYLCMTSPFELDGSMITGLMECKWPGRTQVLQWHDSGITFFLDGAHTVESVKICLNWFRKKSHAISTIGSRECNGDNKVKDTMQEVTRVLLFNCTGDRNVEDLLAPFADSRLFHCVMFSPNTTRPSIDIHSETSTVMEPTRGYTKATSCVPDLINLNVSQQQVSARCREQKEVWLKHDKDAIVNLHSYVADALESLKDLRVSLVPKYGKQRNVHVLVSGSIHLVGSVLRIIDPNLSHSLSQPTLCCRNPLALPSMYPQTHNSKYVPLPA